MKEQDIRQMMTDEGFTELFWRRLSTERKAGRKASQREIFEELNDEYEAEFGVARFPSFDAFRVKRDRRTRKVKK